MIRDENVTRLTEMIGEMTTTEELAWLAAKEIQTAKDALEAKETELLLGTLIDGKNAETRKAQMLQHTAGERDWLRKAEDAYAVAQKELRKLQNELSIRKTIARFLVAED